MSLQLLFESLILASNLVLCSFAGSPPHFSSRYISLPPFGHLSAGPSGYSLPTPSISLPRHVAGGSADAGVPSNYLEGATDQLVMVTENAGWIGRTEGDDLPWKGERGPHAREQKQLSQIDRVRPRKRESLEMRLESIRIHLLLGIPLPSSLPFLFIASISLLLNGGMAVSGGLL